MKRAFYIFLTFSLCVYATSIDEEIINDIEFFQAMEYLEEDEEINFEDLNLVTETTKKENSHEN